MEQKGGHGNAEGEIYLGANLSYSVLLKVSMGDFLPAKGGRLVRCGKQGLMAQIASMSSLGKETVCDSLKSLVQVQKKSKPEGSCPNQVTEKKEFQAL